MIKFKQKYETLIGFIILILLIGYILIPTLKTLNLSFLEGNNFTILHYRELFSIKTNVTSLTNTILLGFSTVVVCGIIGTSLAFFIGYFEFPYKNIASKLLLTPVMVPGVIIVIAFIQL